MNSPSGFKILLTTAKVVVSAALILWIVGNADLDAIFAHLASAHIGLLLIAFSMFFVGYLLTAMRWRLLLATQDVRVSLGPLLMSYMVALFFNNFLPSTVGGDAMRMYDSWRFGSGKGRAVSVILVDRFCGVSALILYGLLFSIVTTEIRQGLPLLPWLLAGATLAAVTVAWLVFGSSGGFQHTVQNKILSRIPVAGKLFSKILDAFAPYRGKGDVLIKAFLLSMLLQLNVIVHFIIVARALDVMVDPMAMFAIIPCAIFVMMLPISINAIGVREAVFVFFFALFGIATEQSVAFAWVAFGFVLAQGVLGGIVFALRKAPDRQNAHLNESGDT